MNVSWIIFVQRPTTYFSDPEDRDDHEQPEPRLEVGLCLAQRALRQRLQHDAQGHSWITISVIQ